MSSRSRVPIMVIVAAALMIAAAISATAMKAAADAVPRPANTPTVTPSGTPSSCPSPTASPSPSGTPSPTATQTQAVPTIALNQVDSVLDFDNQHPVVSGTVTEVLPGTSTPVPYANQAVVLSDSLLGDQTLTTDVCGDFTFAPYASPQPSEAFSVQVPADSSTNTAGTQTQQLTFTLQQPPDPVKIAATLSATKICYCSTPSVSGTVSYAPGSTYQPLQGQPVQVIANGSQVASAVTDSNGHFTVTLPREPASLTWTVQAGGGTYLAIATAQLPMTVELPTVISGFQLTLNQYWQVGFHGCLALQPGVPGEIRSLAGAVIQYSAGRNGPWHTLGAVPQRRGTGCGNNGRTFGGTLNARLNYAFYRAVYAGGSDQAGTGYLPATSGKVLAWKYADRITGFSVSTHKVHQGGKLTVSGRLQFYASGWRNFRGQQVQVILQPRGSKNWYWIVRVNTNSRGYFSATFTDPVSATWAAEYLGDKRHLATVSAMTYVRVTGSGSGSAALVLVNSNHFGSD